MSDAKTRAAEIKHSGLSRVLVAYLQEELEIRKSAVISAKDIDTLRQLQGRAQELTELITFFTEKNNGKS